MEFFTRYEALCKEEGKTATRLALDLGMSRASVNRWRNGSQPKLDALSLIAEHFHVSVDYLLGKTDIKNPPEQSAPEEIAKVALFGGYGEVTEEMWQEVKNYVEFLKQKNFKD